MDVIKSLKDVTNLNHYVSVTQEVITKGKNAKIQINLTTVLTLNKIRSLEIEYLDKCEENGVACFVLERLLTLPPSKTWDMLAKELICLIQYWLQAIRKHLMNHSHNWWTFLRRLLTFIKDIHVKSPCIPNLLVEHIGECLLELATAEKPETAQRYEVLHTFNLFCAESGREIRFALRNKYSSYFIKLSAQMATCGYLPCQFSSLECLIRWLVPRDDTALRSSAANKWFPLDLYPQNSVQVFLRSNWMDFFQEAREFLNALNYANGLVTSVICRKLSLGNLHVINGSERQQYWLDINSSDKSMSVMLDPRILDRLHSGKHHTCQTLLIHTDIVQTVQLHSESGLVTITITTTKHVSVRPCDFALPESDSVVISISSRTDLRKVDVALRRVFNEKYQALLNVNSQVSISPERSFNKGKYDSSEDDTRFSHPVEVKRKRHCGYISRTRNPGGINTPSSVSSSSLLHLREKLTALPRLEFDKEPVRVCAEPQLSLVTELTERDDRSIQSVSTVKLYARNKGGVCHRAVRTKKSQSDSETFKNTKTQRITETIKNKTKLSRPLSPVIDKNISDDNTSLLFMATHGNNSISDDTVEAPNKNNDSNIVNQVIQEVLQRDKIADSGIQTDENKKSQDTENSEAIEGTPVNVIDKPKRNKKPKPKMCTVVSTTDDESNTEVVKETPIFVNVKNRRNNEIQESDVAKTFDMNDVENFFSQHFTENKRGEIVISPTLAKKINETSSESDRFDDNLIVNDNLIIEEDLNHVNEIEIIECLNDIVDKVCEEIDRTVECLNKEANEGNTNEIEVNFGTTNEIQVEKEPYLTSTPKKQSNPNDDKPTKGRRTRAKKADIKIKLKTPKKQKAKRVTAKEIKNSKQTPKKMSTIVEQTEESAIEGNESAEVSRQSPIINLKFDSKKDTPKSRRKRKLYSPNVDDIKIENAPKISDTDDDEVLANFKTNNKPTSSASCYKEIEKERKRYIRSKPRRSSKRFPEPQSPRTAQKNIIFDNLKETVENTEKITLADKHANFDAYNFTSDSEDDDFKKKKIEVKNRISSTATSVNSSVHIVPNRRERRTTRKIYSESKSSNDETNKKPVVKRRQTKKKTEAAKRKSISHDVIEPVTDLVDEKMRTSTNVLNTSIIINQPEQEEIKEIEPLIDVQHEMEPAEIEPPKNTLSKSLKLKKAEIIKVKKEKGIKNEPKAKKTELNVVPDNDGDGTMSPLPGLVVEVAPEPKQDANDSLTTNMLQKFKKIYQEGRAANETNTTQNILSDVERNNNNSQQNISLSVTEQIYFAARDETVVVGNNEISNKAKHNKRRSVDQYMDDVMEICSIPDRNSDVSIATDGITAHGDMEEDPPNLQTIKQNILEDRHVVDLNQSLKEYFEKLTNEINRSSIGSKELSNRKLNRKQEKNLNKSISSENSPVVSVKRLSLEDIRKYLPSCRSSDSEEPKSASKFSNTVKGKQENSNKSMSSEKSQIVPKKRISMDMDRYLPSTKSSDADSQKSKKNVEISEKYFNETPKRKVISTPKNLSGSSRSPIVAVTRISLEEFNKWLPPMPFNKHTDDSDSENDNKPKLSQPKRSSGNLKIVFANDKENLSPEKTDRKPKTPKKASESNEASPKITKVTSNVTRKSIISPVRSFKDFAKHLESDHDSDEEYTKTIKSISKPSKSFYKKYDRILRNSLEKNEGRILESSQELSRSKSSVKLGFRNLDSSLKRRSSPVRQSGKKPRYEDTVTIESGPSVSSIHEWFKHSEPKINDPLQIFNDAIQNVMEKIDTTLVETNQNTSKKFVKLFVDADERLKQMANEFYMRGIEYLKEQAFEFIKEDCKQKRAMVTMLKEDVQATFDRINTSAKNTK